MKSYTSVPRIPASQLTFKNGVWTKFPFICWLHVLRAYVTSVQTLHSLCLHFGMRNNIFYLILWNSPQIDALTLHSINKLGTSIRCRSLLHSFIHSNVFFFLFLCVCCSRFTLYIFAGRMRNIESKRNCLVTTSRRLIHY